MGRDNGELLTRWYQIAFLTPLFRNHHVVDNYDQEPWRFGTRYEDIIRKYVQLRYQLLPYLYTALADAHETGLPCIRPLILENQNDYNALNIEDEFMIGDKLLCAPVLQEGATERELYLPAGEWYEFFNGKKYKGGQYIKVQAPLDTVPLFVKAGSVLPMGPVVDYVGANSSEGISYHVFPNHDGEAIGEIYDDDGNSTAYLKGVSERFALRFKDGKLSSTSKKDNSEKPLDPATVKVHAG